MTRTSSSSRNAARALDGSAHLADQRLDVGSRRLACVQDEVRVLVRDHGAAEPPALLARLLDETARRSRRADCGTRSRSSGTPSGCAAVAPREHRLDRVHRARSVVLELERRAQSHSAGRSAHAAITDLVLRARAPRISPPRSIVVTLSTCVHVSPPKAPAFIASAPPTVPGIPAKNAAGPSCQRTQRFASSMQARPALARTIARVEALELARQAAGRDDRRRGCRRRARKQIRPEPEPMDRRRGRQLGENPPELGRARRRIERRPGRRRAPRRCASRSGSLRRTSVDVISLGTALTSVLRRSCRQPARAAASAQRRRCCPRRASARRRRP